MTNEQLTILMLNRLYWLVTQTPGVARYANDVKLFEGALLIHGLLTQEKYDKRINQYKD